MTFFTRGEKRRKYILKELESEPGLTGIFEIMRSHDGGKGIKRGMGSVCMHPGLFIKTATTSSMVVEYLDEDFIVWFTATPAPCVSLYRPFVFEADGAHKKAELSAELLKYSGKWKRFSRLMVDNYRWFCENVRKERDQLEAVFRKLLGRNSDSDEDIRGINRQAEEFFEDSIKLFNAKY